MIEPRIDETGAHAFGRLAPARDKIEEIPAIFGGPEDEGRGQEHRWLDGSFRQLRIVAIIQHQRLRMQRVIADLGLRWKWLHHGLSRCLEETTNRCLPMAVKALPCAITPNWANRVRWRARTQPRFRNRRRHDA